MSGRQKRRHDDAAFRRDVVSVGSGNLLQQTMRSQQPDAPGHLSALAPRRRGIARGGSEQTGPQIAVAEAGQRELAAIDGGQERGVGTAEGIERPGGTAFPPHRSGERCGEFA